MRSRVILGLGSNTGNRLGFLKKAIHRLQAQPGLEILSVSPIYESEALLPPNAPESWDLPFLNLALLCRTALSPLEILARAKACENQLGRKKRDRWAPREIDIDLLAVDSVSLKTEALTLPHPGLLERPFALLPFFDLVPGWDFRSSPELYRAAEGRVSLWKTLPPQEIPFQTRRSSHGLTELVGIINLTPDSFSDGGTFHDAEEALARIKKMSLEGTSVMDIGAESTRPGAQVLSSEEEWKRLEPVLERLQKVRMQEEIIVSIDTWHPETTKRALATGKVSWINDVSGAQSEEMVRRVADSPASLVLMHSLTVPASREALLPAKEDPIAKILQWAETKIETLARLGLPSDRVIFDPGLGFGKNGDHSRKILRSIERFRGLGLPILVGHSRKSFISEWSSGAAPLRDPETLALSCELASKGVDFLRIHHTDMHARAFRAWNSIHGPVQWQS